MTEEWKGCVRLCSAHKRKETTSSIRLTSMSATPYLSELLHEDGDFDGRLVQTGN